MEKVVYAVQYGDILTVENFIEKNVVKVDDFDEESCSLLHWSAINSRFRISQYLISKFANVNLVGGVNCEIPLQWAVRHPNNTKLIDYLVKQGSNIFHKSIYGFDSLYLAVQEGNTSAALILLNSGADPNTTDLNGETPLYWLLRNEAAADRTNLIRLLIRYNASVVYISQEHGNSMHILLANDKGDDCLDLDLALLFFTTAINRGEGSLLLSGKNMSGLTVKEMAVKRKHRTFLRFLMDAHMYTSLPACTTIVVTSMAVCAVFVIVHHLGWLMGAAGFVPLYFAWQSLSQATIVSAQSRHSCGGAWGVIVTIVSSHWLFLSGDLSAAWNLVIALMAGTICSSLLLTTTTAPQHLAQQSADVRSRDGLVERMVSGQETPDTDRTTEFRLCSTCLADKSGASMHCSRCNICVVDLDHHCPFVCNCVGRGNRWYFVLFTFSASLGCGLFSALSFYTQWTLYCPPTTTGLVVRFVSVQQCMVSGVRNTLNSATWLSLAASVWIFFIFCGQVGLIAGDTTTFQVIKHHNYGSPMCSARGLRSLLLFLRTGQYQVVSPAPAPKAKKAGSARLLAADSGKQSVCGSQHCSHAHHGAAPRWGDGDKFSDSEELLQSAQARNLDV